MKEYILHTYTDICHETVFELPDDFDLKEYMQEHNLTDLFSLQEYKETNYIENAGEYDEDYYAIRHEGDIIYEG